MRCDLDEVLFLLGLNSGIRLVLLDDLGHLRSDARLGESKESD